MAPFWKVTVLEDFAELAIVTAATAVYFDDQDIIQQWRSRTSHARRFEADPHHCWRL